MTSKRRDPQGRRLPVKLDAASNGEYEPVPLHAAAQQGARLGHAAGRRSRGSAKPRAGSASIAAATWYRYSAQQQCYGYPALTRAVKAKIFKLNAARVYGLAPSEMRRKLARDRVQRSRLEYLNDPDPAYRTFGPRNRREFVALRRLQGEP